MSKGVSHANLEGWPDGRNDSWYRFRRNAKIQKVIKLTEIIEPIAMYQKLELLVWLSRSISDHQTAIARGEREY